MAFRRFLDRRSFSEGGSEGGSISIFLSSMPPHHPLLLAEVAPVVPLSATGRQFYTYRLPPGKPPQLYQPVKIPFGVKSVEGFVINLLASSPLKLSRLKTLTIIEAPALTRQQVKFAYWIAASMHGGLGYTLRLFQPPGPNLLPPKIAILPPHQPQPSLTEQTSFTGQGGSLAARLVRYWSQSRPSNIRPLPDGRPPLAIASFSTRALDNRVAVINQLAKHFLTKGQQILVISPELSHTTRLVDRLPNFSVLPGAVYHSALKPRSQRHIWQQVYQGSLNFIIGTQKSLFLPFRQLGLIILEEDFFPSHKLWDQYPRLDNHDGVIELVRIHSASLLYSSSFTSLRSFYSTPPAARFPARLSPHSHLKLIKPSFDDQLQHHSLPEAALKLFRQWRRQGQSSLLLINRRQLGRQLYCRSCRQFIRCQHCGVKLPANPLHPGSKPEVTAPCPGCLSNYSLSACPNCHGVSLIGKAGVSASVASLLSQHGLPNLTVDASTIKRSSRSLHSAGSSPLVVATAAVFSAYPPLKFKHLAWLFPEVDLSYPDYRSIERGLYTLARLSLCSHSIRPTIYLITRRPDLIDQWLNQPLVSTYQRLLQERQRLAYPPVTDLVRLTVKAKTPEESFQQAVKLRTKIMATLKQASPTTKVTVRGPYLEPAYRPATAAHLLLAGPLPQLVLLYQPLPFNRADLSPHQIL